MAKVRFYVDVPEYRINNYNLSAWSQPMPKSTMSGIKRIAFDVDLPPDVWKAFDEAAQVNNVHVTITDDEEPEAGHG